MQEHVTIAHSSGGKSIILDSPEDIERWREARRKNWPSKENLKRKAEERQGMKSRGELLPEETGKNSRHKTGPSWQLKSSLPDSNSHQKLIEETSLTSLLAYASDASDTEPVEAVPLSTENDKKDHSELPMSISSRQNIPSITDTQPTASSDKLSFEDTRGKKRICKFFANGHCTKGKWCKFSHEPVSKSPRQSVDGYQYHGNIVRRGPCLLEKLLSAEQDRETSKVLQCLRHLVLSGKAAL